MDYITRHYKNLSEQLSSKVNHLQQLLNEIATSGIMATDATAYQDSTQPVKGNYESDNMVSFDIIPPWNKYPFPAPGTIVNHNGVQYVYDGGGRWFRNINGQWIIWVITDEPDPPKKP